MGMNIVVTMRTYLGFILRIDIFLKRHTSGIR
jgi:hypothetical protein